MLLDPCVPRRFSRLLAGHSVRTTYQMGWSHLKNGQLLMQAAAAFELFVTVDQNLQYQQNFAALPLTVAIVVASDNPFPTIAPCAAHLLMVLLTLNPRSLITVEPGGKIEIKVVGNKP